LIYDLHGRTDDLPFNIAKLGVGDLELVGMRLRVASHGVGGKSLGKAGVQDIVIKMRYELGILLRVLTALALYLIAGIKSQERSTVRMSYIGYLTT